MTKNFIVVVFIFICSSVKATPDSSIIESLNRKIVDLESSNIILKERIETLNTANDKILQATYFTIAAVLSVIIGVAIWNAISNYQLNSKKIETVKAELQNYFTNYIQDYSAKKIDDKIGTRLSSIKSDIGNLTERFWIFKLKL